MSALDLPSSPPHPAPMRYRLIVGRRREWSWRESRGDAVEDAIKGGHAERDKHDKARIWWHPLAEIEAAE